MKYKIHFPKTKEKKTMINGGHYWQYGGHYWQYGGHYWQLGFCIFFYIPPTTFRRSDMGKHDDSTN